MKKPVLLLVDDDTAVLAALESELRPAFESVLRIEPFERAADVLAAIPAWREEGRAIAVAVVDQRMPERTGVELLTRLRADAAADPAHPALHLRSVLLTGYAGLESATAAKNESGVLRYLEKPWDAGELRTTIREGLARYLARAGAGSYAEFRRITGASELGRVLAVRERVYAETPSVTNLIAEDVEFDVDEFDLVAEHFGLFVQDQVESEAVGSLRICGVTPSSAAAALHAIVRGRPELQARLTAPRIVELPMLKYLEDADAVRDLLAGMRARTETCVEPGRLAVDAAHRAATTGQGRHLARLILEGAVAYSFFQVGSANALLTCIPAHVPFYRPFGFREAEGTRTRLQSALDAPFSCRHGRPEWVPEPARSRCATLAARLSRTGAACRCATFPACAGGPYETGRFEAVDILCPAEARVVAAGSPSPNPGGSNDVP